jgi:hypothetical protein
MGAKLEKVEHGKEKQPYEAPQLTKHGSVEQVTSGVTVLSGFADDCVDNCE